MKKGNQEQICVKLDQASVSALEMECGVSAMPRNRVINRAIIAYCQAVDIARGQRCGIYSAGKVWGWFNNILSPWMLKEKDEKGGE